MTERQQPDEVTDNSVAERFLQRLRVESQIWDSDGRDAWASLGRVGGSALRGNDAEIIAKRLHAEFLDFKATLKRKGIALGSFCQKAGLGKDGEYSKELHRMLLPPGKTARDIGLRRSASKYRRLLAAMASATGESTSTMANRLLFGTTLHPGNTEIRNEVEQVQLMLQAMVDAVDAEFGLFKTFMETARLKARHAAEGGECRWPHYDAKFRTRLFEPPDLNHSLLENEFIVEEDFEAHARARTQMRDAVEREQRAAMDTTRAYWEHAVSRRKNNYESWLDCEHSGSTPSGCLQDDDFFFVPHCYLGFCPDWTGGGEEPMATRDIWLPKLRKSVLETYARYGDEVVDGWNDSDLYPQGQTTSWPDSYGECQWNGWVVIYPTPDNSRLMPMLFVPGEEGGAIMVPLDVITLSALRFSTWISPSGEALTIYERIKSLVGFRPGEQQVMLDSFRRTAPWLGHNPIMKIDRKQAEDQGLMHAFYSQLIHKANGTAEDDQMGTKQTNTGQPTLGNNKH